MNLFNPRGKSRCGTTLIELMLLLSLTGGLMLMTVRVFNMATKVQETGIHTATHLRLVCSLEDRLRNDIALALEVDATAANQLRLVMADSTEVLYVLSKPNLVERKSLKREPGADNPVVGQRWQFQIPYEMQLDIQSATPRTLVRVRLSRLPTDTRWRILREVEVCEVLHGP